jgi:hypothetical protein
MKATKFFLMMALVSFALMSFAGEDVNRDLPKAKISIVQAAHNPGLAKAIYQQVDQSILGGDRPALITATVRYKNTIFTVYGTHNQWMRFFTVDRSEMRTIRIDL